MKNLFYLPHMLVLFLFGMEVKGMDVRLRGSDTLVMLNREWAESYGKRNPGTRVMVIGGGSELGFKELVEGTADIAAASRRIKPEEADQIARNLGAPPIEFPVALDGVAVYVHNQNPVGHLSLEQLKKIYTGVITNWSEVGGPDRRIQVMSRNDESGTTTFFIKNVLHGEAMSQDVMKLPSTRAVAAMVSKIPGAIGFGGIAYAEGGRILRLIHPETGEAVWPSNDDIENGRYPLSRFLYYYVSPLQKDEPELKRFLAWLHSEQAQAIADRLHYVPLSRAFIAGYAETPDPGR